MFLAGEYNCTAQRPLVTQIKGDSAEGERAVRVFLSPEKWGRSVVLALSLPPQVQLTWAGVRSFVSRGLWWMKSLSPCWLCGFTASSGELWCPHWAEFCRLGKGELGGFNHDVPALASHGSSVTCVLFHIKFHPSMLPKTFLEAQWHFSIKVREWIYSFLQQTQNPQSISCSEFNKIMILKDISFSRLLHLACL